MKNAIIRGCLVTFSSRFKNKCATYGNKFPQLSSQLSTRNSKKFVHHSSSDILLSTRFLTVASAIRRSTSHRLHKKSSSRENNILRVIFMFVWESCKNFLSTFPFIFSAHSMGLWRVSCSNLEVNALRLFRPGD